MSPFASPDPATVDIAIIGGGVAGSSLAIVLQRAGWRTLVVEREPLFKDRVRGEACHPWGVKELIELDLKTFVDQIGGLELPVWSVYKDAELDSEMAWGETFPGTPPELGFSHADLQEALLQGAQEAGARVLRPARAHIARQHDDWMLHIEHDDSIVDVSARFLVAADGKTGATRRLWDAQAVTAAPHHSFGGMLATGIDLPQNSAHQGWYDSGFSMSFPQGNDRWRVYYTCPTEEGQSFTGEDRISQFLQAVAACYPAGAFENAQQAGPLAFFPNAHIGCSRIDGPMAVCIGDAAGAGDPSQGHGMSLVWRDVRVLRDLLASESLSAVPAMFANQRQKYEHVLRTHSEWVAPLTTGTGAETEALKQQVDAAREQDPTALGYAAIFANGPDGLPTDDAARAQFFGEHLTDSPVNVLKILDKPI